MRCMCAIDGFVNCRVHGPGSGYNWSAVKKFWQILAATSQRLDRIDFDTMLTIMTYPLASQVIGGKRYERVDIRRAFSGLSTRDIETALGGKMTDLTLNGTRCPPVRVAPKIERSRQRRRFPMARFPRCTSTALYNAWCAGREYAYTYDLMCQARHEPSREYRRDLVRYARGHWRSYLRFAKASGAERLL